MVDMAAMNKPALPQSKSHSTSANWQSLLQYNLYPVHYRVVVYILYRMSYAAYDILNHIVFYKCKMLSTL